jgi:hypothetical protein
VEESVELTPEVEAVVGIMNDTEARSFFHGIDKLAHTPALEKERVAVLNDRFDIYLLEAAVVEQVLTVARDPGPKRSLVVSVTPRRPSGDQAARDAAVALKVPVISVHVF